MKTVKTFEAKIYVGLRPAYNNDYMFDDYMVRQVCQEYCNTVSLCVTVSPTQFYYKETEGVRGEFGAVVGLINYPRFPSTEKEIVEHAKTLGYELLKNLKQNRVTIVTTNETIMLEKDDPENET